jgi:hypothetical protein
LTVVNIQQILSRLLQHQKKKNFTQIPIKFATMKNQFTAVRIASNAYCFVYVTILVFCISFQNIVAFQRQYHQFQYSSPQIKSKWNTKLQVAIGHNNFNDRQSLYTSPATTSTATSSSHKMPIDLPNLTTRELQLLARGERIQKQTRTNRSGFGLVVVEVPTNDEIVFQTLSKFQEYPELIRTIRAAKITSQSDTIYKAQYSFSKFMLKVNIIHTIQAEQVRLFFLSSRKAFKSNLFYDYCFRD